jgi:hypothetical protein
VHVGEARPEHEVLECGRDPVAENAVHRHPASARVAQACETGPEGHVRVPGQDRGDEERHRLGVVLVVGVEEHDNVRTLLDRSRVAGLLVAAVPAVLRVHVDRDPELACELDGVVGARVVDEDERVGRSGRDLGDGLLERPLGPVGGQGDHDLGPARRSTRLTALGVHEVGHDSPRVPAVLQRCRPRGSSSRHRRDRPRRGPKALPASPGSGRSSDRSHPAC